MEKQKLEVACKQDSIFALTYVHSMNRITIITICFNNLEELQKTCESVDTQQALPFEHLVINGSTKDVIANYLDATPQPPYRRWINERDKGIADAFNKGVEHATGDILVHLNSGDLFYDNTVLEKVLDAFHADASLQWLHGKVKLYRGGKWVIVGKPFELSKLYRGMRSISHQSVYVRKSMFEKHGLFDTGLRYAMDYDFICRIAPEKNAFVDYPFATYDPHGVSSSQYLKSMAEGRRVFRRYYKQPVKQTLWRIRLYLLYVLLNSPIGKALYAIKSRLKLENM